MVSSRLTMANFASLDHGPIKISSRMTMVSLVFVKISFRSVPSRSLDLSERFRPCLLESNRYFLQHHAHDLLELVSGPGGPRRLPGHSDFSLEMLHRASVVAQTKISFRREQVLQLIHEYLLSQVRCHLTLQLCLIIVRF